MLSKQTGPSQVITVGATTSTITVTNTDGSSVRKVRIATQTNPVLVAFNTTTNLITSGIMIPGSSSEHFALDNSTKITIVRGSATDVLVSITPVA
jgi:hypothetical protein